MSSKGRERRRSRAWSTLTRPACSSVSSRFSLSVSTRGCLGGVSNEDLIHTARAEAGQVQRHVCIAQRLELFQDLLAMCQHLFKIVRLYFDAGDLVVVAHPQLAQAQLAEGQFVPLDLRQGFQGNRGTI